MGLTKKQLDEINKRALNKVARSNKSALPQNNPTTNIADETLRRNTLQLNQTTVEPLPFGDNNPFSTNNMLASYQAFKQQPFNELQKFELQKNNTYKGLMKQVDTLRTEADNRLKSATAYRGIHKDLNGNDVEINNLKDYISFLKNTNDPQADNQDYINKLYKDEEDALIYSGQNKKKADEIEKIANEKIEAEVKNNVANADDLIEYRKRVNDKYVSMPYNSEEKRDIGSEWRQKYQDITNFKEQEQIYNNVPDNLRTVVENAIVENNNDAAVKVLKDNGYDESTINSIISKAERNRDYAIAKKETEETEKFAKEHPVLASLESIGNAINPVDNFKAAGELLNYRLGQSVRTNDQFPAEAFNQYNEAQRSVNKKNTEREVVANSIDNPLIKSGYNIGMSVVDNTVRMAEAAVADRVVPGSGRFINGLLASLDVGASTIKDGEDRGLNTAQIASTALADAINEQLFETLSFDKVVNTEIVADNAKSFLKSIAKSAGIEGSEELFTDVANEAADRVINGDQAEMNQNYQKLLEAGYSESDANKIIWTDKAKQLAESFIAGAISGGIMQGGIAGTDYIRNKTTENKTLKSVGKNIISTGNNQRMKNLVENMQIDNEETKKIASDTDWNDALSVGHTITELINYENDITDNIFKTNMHNELANKLSTLKDNDGNAIEGVDELADRIMNGLSFSPYDSVQEVIKQYKDFMEGKTTESNDYLKNVNNADLKQHSDNLATLARLTTERIESVNTENETPKEQKSLKTQNTALQGIVKNNEKSYVLDNPNQKFDILTLAVDKEGNTKVVAKDSHEYFNPDKVALDRETAQLVEVSRDFSKEKKQAFFAAAEEGMSNVANFTVAFNRAYDTGKQGLGIATAFSDAKINLDLNNEQVEKAYQAGLDQYVLDAQNKTKNIQKAKNTYTGTVDTSNININNLDEAQKSALNVLNVLADNVGVDFELFESKTDKEGRYVGENGSYNINNNKIRIDINAGLRVEGEKRNTMIVTLAHELTHSFEYNAPEAYAELQEFVFDKLTKQTKKTADELILEDALKLEAKDKQNNVQTKSKDKYIEIAKSEIVARSCERLLTDEAAIKELAYTDQGLFGKIKAWIEQLCENIKAAYRDLFDNEGNLKEGIVAEEANMLKDFENKLRTIWNNAAVEATKNTEKVAIAKNATGKDNNILTKESDKTDKKSESKKKFENAKKKFENAKEDFETRYENVYNAINDIYAEYLNKNEAVAKRAGLETFDLLNYYTKISPEEAMNDTDFSVDGFKNIYKEIYNGLIKNEDAITGHEYQKIKEDKGENNLYSFAGRESATADLEMLKKAQQMSKEHKFKQDILDQTGWFKGVDGKWRYEIDNSDAKIKDGVIDFNNAVLSDILEAPNLYNAYPGIENFKIIVKDLEGNTRGIYDEAKERITLNKNFATNKFVIDAEKEAFSSKEYKDYRKKVENLLFNNKELTEVNNKLIKVAKENDEEKFNQVKNEYKKIKEKVDKKELSLMKEWEETDAFKKLKDTREKYSGIVNQFSEKNNVLSTLLHEIQHAIQGIEDFERGSNPDFWKFVKINNRLYLGYGERELQEKREKTYMDFKEKMYEKYGNDIIYLEEFVNNENSYNYAILNDKDTSIIEKWYDESLEKVKEIGGEEAVKDARKISNLWDKFKKYEDYAARRNNQEPFDLYWNTVGEIEARDVQERLNNKSLFPKVGDHSLGMVSSGGVQDISDDQVLFQERDYNVEYNKELYKKYGFNIEFLSDYQKDKESIVRYLKLNSEVKKDFINNKIEPLYKNKPLKFDILEKDKIKQYIIDNNITAEKIINDSKVKNKLYNIINNYINNQEKKFLKNIYSFEFEELKKTIETDLSINDLKEDIKLLYNPEKIIDTQKMLEKEDEYVKENDAAFTEFVEKIVDRLLDASQNPKSEAQILAENLKTYKSPYQELRTKVRNGWTIDKIQRELKKESSSVISKREINKFKNIEEILENVFYHGSISANSRLKAGSTLRPEQRTGGYGEAYHSISLSKDKDIASIFASTGSSGNVIPVILKKGAVVVDMKNIEDSIELEEILPELWNKQIDAVKIGDWNKKIGTEKEIVILNPKAIMTIPQGIEYFKNTNKPKFKNLTKNELKDLIKKSTDSDVRYQARYNEALENENLEEVEKIVEDYAATKGYTQKVYHGTQQFGFTEIDLSKSDDDFSFWTTDSLETASTYSGEENITPVKEGITIGETPEDKIKAYKKVIENPDLDISYIKADEQLKKKYYLDINLKTIKKGLNRLDEYYKTKEKRTYRKEFWEKTYNELVDLINKEIDTKTVDMELIKKLDNKLYGIGPYNVGISDEYSMLPYLLNGTGTLIDAIQDKKSMYAESHGTYYSRKSEESMDWYINNSGLTFGNYEFLADLSGDFREVYAYGENWNNIEVNAKHKNYSSEEIIKMMKNEFDSIENVKYDKKKNTFISKLKNGNEVIKTKEEMLDIFNLSDKYATELKRATTRDIVKEAKEQGYDGVIIRRVVDNGGRNYNLPYMIQPANIYIFFNPQQQLKSADPVTYNNNGKIIPLAERFDPDNVDIRFQDRYDKKLYQKALAENKMYQELVEKLERQLDLRPYINLTKTDATKLARIIKNNTKTYMKLDELADRIITSFREEKAEQTTHQDSFWLRFRLNKIVNEAFDRVKEDSKNRTAYANQILGDLRKTRIKLSDAQKKECAYYFGTYNNFRKHMMGKVIFSNNGSSIDHVWNELSMLYPDVFNPDVNDTDMPMMLDSIITELQNMYVSDIGLNKKDAADFIVTELIAEFTGMKPQKTINQIKKEMHNYSVEASRKIKELREKNIEQRRIYEERLRNVNAQLKSDVWLQNEKEALRNGIKRNARYLNTRFLRPRNGAFIPEKYQKAVAEFLYAFEDNTREFGNDELDAALIIQKAFRDSEDDYISQEAESEELSDMLKRLSDNLYGRKLSMLNLQELEETADLLSSLRKIIENAQKAFVNGKTITINAAGKELAQDFKKHKRYKSLQAGEGLKNIISVNNLTPYYYFDSIGSYASKLFGLLREGQDKAAKNIAKAREFIQDTKKEYNYDNWDFDKTIRIGDISLNVEEAMSVYATLKRQKKLKKTQDGKHTTIGGIILDKKLKTMTKNGKVSLVYETVQKEAQTVNEAALIHIINFLTDEQIAYADKIVGYLSNEMADLGNEVSMRLHGYKKFKESYYFPYRSSSDWITREESGKNDALPSLKNSGFTKALTKRAHNAVIIGDFTETAANHINQMITYNGLAEPQDVVNRVFSYKEPIYEKNELGEQELVGYGDINKTLFRYYMGDGYVKYYQEFMRKINGGMMADPAESEFSKFLTIFKKNSVLANLSVAIQQPSAIVRASAYIEPKYFAKTVFNNRFAKKKWEDIKKYSGVAILKEIGGYDVSTTWGITDYIADTRKEGLKKAQEKVDDTLGRLPGKMDEITWCHIWDAAMRKIKANNPSLSGKELKERTAILFDKVINATQVYDSMLSRSMNMSSKKQYMQMITAFMSEPTISLNMLLASVNDAKNGNTRAGARKIKAVIGSVLLNSILVAFIRAMRDKDRDKSYIERYIKSAADNFIHDINPLNMMPFVKDVLEVLQGYDVKRTDTEAIRNMVDGLKEGWKSFQNGDTVKGIEDFASAIGSVTGVPIRNIVRDIEGVRNTIIDGINNNVVPRSSSDVLEALKEGSLNIEFSIQAAVDEYTDTKDKKLLDRIKKEIRKNVKDKHPDYNEQQIEKEVNARLKVRLTQSYKQKYLSSNIKKKKAIINAMENTHLYKSKRVKNFGEDNSKETALSWEIQELKKKYIAGNRKQRIEIRKKLYATGHWKKLADLDKQLKKWLD